MEDELVVLLAESAVPVIFKSVPEGLFPNNPPVGSLLDLACSVFARAGKQLLRVALENLVSNS